MPKISAIGPVELPFRLFVDIPEDVRGDEVYAAGFHFLERFVPKVVRVADVVEFANDGEHRFVILLHVETGETDRIAVRILAAHLEAIRRLISARSSNVDALDGLSSGNGGRGYEQKDQD